MILNSLKKLKFTDILKFSIDAVNIDYRNNIILYRLHIYIYITRYLYYLLVNYTILLFCSHNYFNGLMYNTIFVS